MRSQSLRVHFVILQSLNHQELKEKLSISNTMSFVNLRTSFSVKHLKTYY